MGYGNLHPTFLTDELDSDALSRVTTRWTRYDEDLALAGRSPRTGIGLRRSPACQHMG